MPDNNLSFTTEKINYDDMAKKLKFFRQLENYTQKDLARIIGISRQAYTHYETGKSTPDIDTLFCLSKLYQIPINTLLETAKSANNNHIRQFEQLCAYSEEFINFFNSCDNRKKYFSLSLNEKQLIFYYQKLPRISQKEFLLQVFIKYILSS